MAAYLTQRHVPSPNDSTPPDRLHGTVWGPGFLIGMSRLPEPGSVPVARTIRYVMASAVTLYSNSCLVLTGPSTVVIIILELVNSIVAGLIDEFNTPRPISRCRVHSGPT